MDKQQHFRPQKNSPPPPYDSSISSFSPSSLSHDGEGPEHSLHPSPTPQQESSRKQPTKTRSDKELLEKVNLWFRVLGFLFCLISFSIMADDRNKGWTLDSFHRYIEFRYVWDLLINSVCCFVLVNIWCICSTFTNTWIWFERKKNCEYLWFHKLKFAVPCTKKKCKLAHNIFAAAACRYCLTVNVIGFVYSALQGTDLAYQLFSSSGKLLVSASHRRYIIDFASDQVPLFFSLFLLFCIILLGSIIFVRIWSRVSMIDVLRVCCIESWFTVPVILRNFYFKPWIIQ